MHRILIVDADHWDGHAIEDRVRKLGVYPILVKTPPEAIRVIEQSRHRLTGVISDVHPGFVLINWINKNWEHHPEILMHCRAGYVENVDLRSFDWHLSGRVTFTQQKARVMTGSNEQNYAYITEFVLRVLRQP